MDETLKMILAELQKTNSRIDAMDSKFSSQMEAMSADIQEIKADTKQIKKEVHALYEWVDNVDIEVKDLKSMHSA